MQKLRHHEQNLLDHNDIINAYNKIHAYFKVRVEWCIRGLKCTSKKLLKTFDSTKSKYIILFKVVGYLINYLHRRRLDFIYHVIKCNNDEDDDG